MFWIILYIISAFLVYIFAYKFIRFIDKKERKKRNKWEYTTLGEIREMINSIFIDLNNKEINVDNLTLGALMSFVEEKESELKK